MARIIEDPVTNIPLMDLGPVRDASEIEKRVHELAEAYPGSIYELALYAFRSIHVKQPEAYFQVALHGHRTREAAADIQSIGHAIETVAGIPGNSSIFDTPQRLALPDEVLQFQTGSQRDKALLLYCLIRHSTMIPETLKEELTFNLADETNFLQNCHWHP